MRILTIITGEYGRRHVENIRAHAPDDWSIDTWEAPAFYPPVIDYPEDHLPESLPGEAEGVDLILAFGEHKGVAELLPEIVRRTEHSPRPTTTPSATVSPTRIRSLQPSHATLDGPTSR